MEIEIILEFILIIIGLYLALFKSYFKEKGKNLATSEDIEDLTLKVESVKQQFIEKNANIKAKLDLLTNLQISHKNDERLAIIEFHKRIQNWIGLLSEPSPNVADDYNDDEIQAKIHSYNTVYQDLLAAEALLELYNTDKKLFELIRELKIKTIENLGTIPTKTLIDIKTNNYMIRQLETEQDLEKKSKEHKTLLAERQSIYKRYREKMLEGYKIIIPLQLEYRDYAVEYLKSISNK